jgi:hypothetical protein
MATITTYLLVSGPETPETVSDHEVFTEYAFDHRGTQEAGEHQLPAVTFALEQPLEEADDLDAAVRKLSLDLPAATVVLCEVEERFDQVERLQLCVYSNGKRGGTLDHGYVFNVGSG